MKLGCFQVAKKKYHISTKRNTVYDITDRKVSASGGTNTEQPSVQPSAID